MSEQVVVKLVSGELFMATVIGDSPDSLIVHDPVAVRQIAVTAQGGVIERTVTNPFCSLTDEREYSFDWRHILFVKPLSPKISKYYSQLLSEINSSEEDNPTALFETDDQEEVEQEPTLVIPDKHSIH